MSKYLKRDKALTMLEDAIIQRKKAEKEADRLRDKIKALQTTVKTLIEEFYHV